MSEVADPLNAAIGIKISSVAWGLIGGATAAALGPNSWRYRVVTSFTGGFFAVAFGPAFAHFLDALENDRFGLTREEVSPGAHYLCGLVGMIAAGMVVEAFKRVRLPKQIVLPIPGGKD